MQGDALLSCWNIPLQTPFPENGELLFCPHYRNLKLVYRNIPQKTQQTGTSHIHKHLW